MHDWVEAANQCDIYFDNKDEEQEKKYMYTAQHNNLQTCNVCDNYAHKCFFINK